MVAPSGTTSSTDAHAKLRAALDLVLQEGWSTISQLALVGHVDVSTVRRWRRGACRIESVEVVDRWINSTIHHGARMAFALAITSSSDLHVSRIDRDLDFDHDGHITPHDCLKALLRAQVHIATMQERVLNGVATHDHLAAVRHEGAEAMSLIPAAIQALAVSTTHRPRRPLN